LIKKRTNVLIITIVKDKKEVRRRRRVKTLRQNLKFEPSREIGRRFIEIDAIRQTKFGGFRAPTLTRRRFIRVVFWRAAPRERLRLFVFFGIVAKKYFQAPPQLYKSR